MWTRAGRAELPETQTYGSATLARGTGFGTFCPGAGPRCGGPMVPTAIRATEGKDVDCAPSYLDMQAEIGITKHNGGFPATDRLLQLCHAGTMGRVLYVGSGIGVGPSYLARTRGCRVVAADVSPKMLEWTAKRARRDGVAHLVEPALADVLDLPFADASFDLVLVESVLAFVEDKERAIGQCVRVARPGGWVGMNEAVWRTEEPTGRMAIDANALGTWLVTQQQWCDLWDGSGLVDRAFEPHDLSLGEEARSRLRWIGLRWLLPAWGRALRIAATDARAREAMRTQLSYPPSLARLMAYCLSAGRRV